MDAAWNRSAGKLLDQLEARVHLRSFAEAPQELRSVIAAVRFDHLLQRSMGGRD